MSSEDLKFALWFLFIAYIVVIFSIEYPLFGALCLVAIISFSVWLWMGAKKINKEIKIEREIQTKEDRSKNRLLDQVAKDLQTIIEKDFKTVAAAYRSAVSSNAFGKKNYDKFAPQLQEYLRDNSKVLNKLKDEFDTNVEFNVNALIEFIELRLKQLDKEFEYTDDMNPYDYEHFCAAEFNKIGWDANATQGSSDQGVDVIATKNDVTLVAQCKKFMKPVGNKAVQEIVAGMKFYGASIGLVIAPNGYTNSAKKLAEANSIKLIHHSEIESLE